MKLDFKRFLSSVLAFIMIVSSFAFNGTLAYADEEPQPDMAITDLSVEGTPTEEPVFINLGTPESPALLGAEARASATVMWDSTTTAATNADIVFGLSALDIAKTLAISSDRAVSFADINGGAALASKTGLLISSNGVTITPTQSGELTLYVAREDNSDGTFTVTPSDDSGAKSGTAVNRKTANATPTTMTVTKDVKYTLATSDSNVGLFGLKLVYDDASEPPVTSYANVTVTQDDENGTFTLTGESGKVLNATTPSATAADEAFAVGGTKYALSITAPEGKEVDTVTATGATLSGSGSSYTVTVDEATVTITITYKTAVAVEYSAVNVTNTGSNGTFAITDSEGNTVTEYAQLTPGATYTITVTPNSGFEVAGVENATATENANVYTFTAAAANGSVDLTITYNEVVVETTPIAEAINFSDVPTSAPTSATVYGDKKLKVYPDTKRTSLNVSNISLTYDGTTYSYNDATTYSATTGVNFSGGLNATGRRVDVKLAEAGDIIVIANNPGTTDRYVAIDTVSEANANTTNKGAVPKSSSAVYVRKNLPAGEYSVYSTGSGLNIAFIGTTSSFATFEETPVEATQIDVPVSVSYTGEGIPTFTITATPSTVTTERPVVTKESVGTTGTTLSLWDDTEYTIEVSGLGSTFNAATVDPTKLTPVSTSKITVTVTDASVEPPTPTGNKVYVFGTNGGSDTGVTYVTTKGTTADGIIDTSTVNTTATTYFQVRSNQSTKRYIAIKANAGETIKVTNGSNNAAAIYSDITLATKVSETIAKNSTGEYVVSTTGTYYLSSDVDSGNANISKIEIVGSADPITVTLTQTGATGTVKIGDNEVTDTLELAQGATYPVVITAPAGYKIDTVSDNLTPTATVGTYSYTAPATATDTITVTYTAIPKYTLTIVNNAPEGTTPTVTVTGNGSALTLTDNKVDVEEGTAIVVNATLAGYTTSISEKTFTMTADKTVTISYTEIVEPTANSWTAGETVPSWLSLSSTSTSNNPNAITFEDGTAFATTDKVVKIARDKNTSTGTFTFTAPAGAHVKIYVAANSNNTGAIAISDSTGASVRVDSTTVDAKKSTSANVVEADLTNGGTYTVTLSKGDSNGYNLFKVVLEGEMQPFTVAGKVTDVDDVAISGATVTASTGVSVTTDANGAYSFADPFDAPVTLTITATGYVGKVLGPISATTANADAQLSVEGEYTATVNVKDGSTNIDGATVTATRATGEVLATATTDSTGVVTFDGLKGNVVIKVTKDGYSTYTETLEGTATSYTVNASITNKITVKFLMEDGSEKPQAAISFFKGLIEKENLSGSNLPSFNAGSISTATGSVTFEAQPGDVYSFRSTATNVYKWQAYKNENGTIENDSKERIAFVNGFASAYVSGATSRRFFTYTVPADAKPGSTYGIIFTAGAGAKTADIDAEAGEAIKLNGQYTIGYGSYGYGDDKIGTNAGLVSGDKPYALTEAEVNSYKNRYSAREHMNFILARPTMDDFCSQGAADTTYNVIANDASKYRIVNNNLYAILDSSIAPATVTDPDTGVDTDITKSFLQFKLNVPGKDEVDVVIDATTRGKFYTINVNPADGGTPEGWSTITGASGKQKYTLKTGYTYVIQDADGDSNRTYIKSIRIFNNDNVFSTTATSDTVGTTTVNYTDMDPESEYNNFKSYSVGTVADVKSNNPALASALGLDSISDTTLNIYRVVARINVPASAESAEQYVSSLDSVGFDVYDSAVYNAEEESRKSETTATHVNKVTATSIDTLGTISFTQTNSCVVDPSYDLAGVNYQKIPADKINHGSIGSANLADVYVQTYIATNTSLTLVPFSVMNEASAYSNIPIAEKNIAKVVG